MANRKCAVVFCAETLILASGGGTPDAPNHASFATANKTQADTLCKVWSAAL